MHPSWFFGFAGSCCLTGEVNLEIVRVTLGAASTRPAAIAGDRRSATRSPLGNRLVGFIGLLNFQHGAAELDEVVVDELVPVDAPVVDVGAVGGARVTQAPYIPFSALLLGPLA